MVKAWFVRDRGALRDAVRVRVPNNTIIIGLIVEK